MKILMMGVASAALLLAAHGYSHAAPNAETGCFVNIFGFEQCAMPDGTYGNNEPSVAASATASPSPSSPPDHGFHCDKDKGDRGDHGRGGRGDHDHGRGRDSRASDHHEGHEHGHEGGKR